MKLKSLHELDVIIGDDQPVSCPKCGSRTEFKEIAEDYQQHQCLACSYEFFLDLTEVANL